MTEHAVVIAGGGPTGLMLAAELALAGADALIVERRTTQDLDGSRAGGLHARTIEVLDQRGVAERFLAAGQTHEAVGFAGMSLSISDFPTRHNYLLALWQRDFERILAEWVLGDLGVPILRGCEVVGFTQAETGVDVELSDGTSLGTGYLVGCDGGRSVVRKAASIGFPGWDPSTSWIIAEAEMGVEPKVGVRRGGGIGPVNRDTGGGPYRVVLMEPSVEHAAAPTMQDLRDALMAEDGTDYAVHSPTWISRFTDMSRQAACYRQGRVLLAGDAAHIHGPQGGQGLNVGVQDAVNLGWKLAEVVNGTSPDSLLDTYHDERHPVGARVVHNTMAQVALGTPDDRHQALRHLASELLAMDEPRRRIAAMISGLDVHYDVPYEVGEKHPLLGRRMPDLDVHTADGTTRVFRLLHDVEPVLLRFGGGGACDITPWADRVKVVDAEHERAEQDGVWQLPLIGDVPAPPAVLIRPDGHVAWTGDLGDPNLPRALATWFGAGRAGDVGGVT